MGQLIVHSTPIKSRNSTVILFPRFGFLNRLFDGSLAKLAGIYPTSLSVRIDSMPVDPAITIRDPNFRLKEHQIVIINHIIATSYTQANIMCGRAGLITKVDTGYGKTYIGIGLINAIKRPTLIIVHNKPQVEDWYKICASVFGEENVGAYHSQHKKDGKILVMTVQSALLEKYNFGRTKKDQQEHKDLNVNEMFGRFDFVIFDECHKFCSKKFSQVFTRTQYTFMLGLSATPTNGDLWQVGEWNIGPIRTMKDELSILADLKEEFTGQIQVIDYYGPPSHTIQLLNAKGQSNHVGMIKQILDDPHRNHWIAMYLLNLAHSGRNTYVFAVILEGLRNIRSILLEHIKNAQIKAKENGDENDEKNNITVLDEEELKQYDENWAMLTGGAKPEEIERVSRSAKIIFSTYGYMGTGKSIPRMDTIMFVTPHKTGTSQYIGRIFRPGPNQTTPRLIIDIVDKRLKLSSQFSSRKKIYNEQEQIGRHLTMSHHPIRAPQESSTIPIQDNDDGGDGELDSENENDEENENGENENDLEELKQAFHI